MECLEPEDMNSKAQLHMGKVLGASQHASFNGTLFWKHS